MKMGKYYNQILNRIEAIKEKKHVLSFYKRMNDDLEIKEIMDYVRQNGLKIFNYNWADSIAKMKPEIFFDSDKKMYYQIIREDRLYLKRNHKTEISRKNCCIARMRDQYEMSPHCYKNYMGESKRDVIIDVGAAEGNFALDYIDYADKVIIIEPDLSWIEALNMTFEKYKDKIIIINKFLSDICDEENITIDSLMEQELIHCDDNVVIKMDIEGSETKALNGGKVFLSGMKQGMVIACSYHSQNAQDEITYILREYGYKTSHSPGYMYFPKRYERNLFPERNGSFESLLRRGLVVGEK